MAAGTAANASNAAVSLKDITLESNDPAEIQEAAAAAKGAAEEAKKAAEKASLAATKAPPAERKEAEAVALEAAAEAKEAADAAAIAQQEVSRVKQNNIGPNKNAYKRASNRLSGVQTTWSPMFQKRRNTVKINQSIKNQANKRNNLRTQSLKYYSVTDLDMIKGRKEKAEENAARSGGGRRRTTHKRRR